MIVTAAVVCGLKITQIPSRTPDSATIFFTSWVISIICVWADERMSIVFGFVAFMAGVLSCSRSAVQAFIIIVQLLLNYILLETGERCKEGIGRGCGAAEAGFGRIIQYFPENVLKMKGKMCA